LVENAFLALKRRGIATRYAFSSDNAARNSAKSKGFVISKINSDNTGAKLFY